MSFENVNLWYAKDKNDKIVVINEVDKNIKDKYYCPLCGSEVIPRQGSEKAWCFAHIDKSECSSESMYHYWCKHKLLKMGDKFIIRSDKKREYICKEILVEKTYKVNGKEYRPDLTVITEDSKTIYFEMEYTNEKKIEDYIDIWMELGSSVVQVDVKTLINSKSAELPIFKALWYEGKCFNVKKGEDSIYHETIGKYKEKYHNKDINEKKKADIERLDWLWRDIKKYKMGEVDIEHISNLIQSIEDENSKSIFSDVLKRTSCNNIIEDYIEYNKNSIIEYLNETKYVEYYKDYDIKIDFKPLQQPRKIYDRIFENGIKIKGYIENIGLELFSIIAFDKTCIKKDISEFQWILDINQSMKYLKTIMPNYDNFKNINFKNRIRTEKLSSIYLVYDKAWKNLENENININNINKIFDFEKIYFNEQDLWELDSFYEDILKKYDDSKYEIKLCVEYGKYLKVELLYKNISFSIIDISKQDYILNKIIY